MANIKCPFKDPIEARDYDVETPCPVCGATGDMGKDNVWKINECCPEVLDRER